MTDEPKVEDQLDQGRYMRYSMQPKYFKQSEFKCKCKTKCRPFYTRVYVEDSGLERKENVWVEEKLLWTLEIVRRIIGKPIKINSGYRCSLHNREVGGAENSQHVLRRAADLAYPEGISKEEFISVLDKVFETGGMGVYPNFVHVDVRRKKARW